MKYNLHLTPITVLECFWCVIRVSIANLLFEKSMLLVSVYHQIIHVFSMWNSGLAYLRDVGYIVLLAVTLLTFNHHVDSWPQHCPVSEVLPALAWQSLHWYCTERYTNQLLLTPKTRHWWRTHGEFDLRLKYLILLKDTISFSGVILSDLWTGLWSYTNLPSSLRWLYLIIAWCTYSSCSESKNATNRVEKNEQIQLWHS